MSKDGVNQDEKTILSYKANGEVKTAVTKITAGSNITIDRKKDASGIFDLDEVEISSSGKSGADVDVTAGSIPITGNMVISSGSIDLDLGSELKALSEFSGLGLVTRVGEGSYQPRSLIAGSGVNIINPDAVNGNPVISVDSSIGADITLTGSVNGTGKGTINTVLNPIQELNSSLFQLNLRAGYDQFNINAPVNNSNVSFVSHAVGDIVSGTYWRIEHFINKADNSFNRDLKLRVSNEDYTFYSNRLVDTINGKTPLTSFQGLVSASRIVGLDLPQNNTDAASKEYVDNAVAGGDVITEINTIGNGIIADRFNSVVNLNLNDRLKNIASTISTGFIAITNSSNATPRTFEAGYGIDITNPNGITGNPIFSLSNNLIIGLSGAITGSAQGSIDNINTELSLNQKINDQNLTWDWINATENRNSETRSIKPVNFDAPAIFDSKVKFKRTDTVFREWISKHEFYSRTQGYDDVYRFKHYAYNSAQSHKNQDIFQVLVNDVRVQYALFGDVELVNGRIYGLNNPLRDDEVATKSYVDENGGGQVTLTGAVTGSGSGSINTTLSNIQNLPITDKLQLNWNHPADNGEVYFEHNLGIIDIDVSSKQGLQNVISQKNINGDQRKWIADHNLGTVLNDNPYFSIKYFNDAVSLDKEYFKIEPVSNVTYFFTQLDLQYNKIINVGNPSSYYDVANKGYVDNKTVSPLINSEILINTSGGSDHYLRRSNLTKTGVTIFNQNSNSFILEQRIGESAGLAVNGDSDGCTIWSPGDSGAYLNIQDEDSSNSRVAYVSSSGSWTQVSSAKRKHSIKTKANNNVLDRLMQLSVKSYGYKQEKRNNSSEKRNIRIEKKANKMHVGLILEELFTLFPNCVPDYYNGLFKKKKANKNLKLEEEVKDISNSGIDYNVLFCYLIMGFQEYVNKANNEIGKLKSTLKQISKN